MDSDFFVMTLENGSINIGIPDSHRDVEKLKIFIKNNFEEFYFGRNTIILYQDILASQKSLDQRKNMLEWLYKRSLKDSINQSGASFISQNYKKTIKISFRAQNLSTQTTKINILKQSDNLITVSVKNEPTALIYNYLKAKFILHTVYQDRNSQFLKIRISNQKVIDELNILIQKKSLVGKRVAFTYPQELFQTSRQQASQSGEDSVKDKILKLRNSYEALELNYLIKDIGIVKERYRSLAKKYHPDRFYYTNPSQAKEYEEKFISIKEAYETICRFIEQKSA